jgi:hypothetical protein
LPDDATRRNIHFQVAHPQALFFGSGNWRGNLVSGPAQDRPDPGDQLAGVERLSQIIVRPDLQPDDAIHLIAAGGEHEHGYFALFANSLQGLESIAARKHHIQNDQRVGSGARLGDTLVPVMAGFDLKPLIDQKFLEKIAQFNIIIHKQQRFGRHPALLSGPVAPQGLRLRRTARHSPGSSGAR